MGEDVRCFAFCEVSAGGKCAIAVRFLRERRRMRFDLTDLRLFCDVVETGSITAGAEKSALALAAASTRIRNMEAALGAPLLVRSRQG
ncbi:MAG TPA: LysR family transcriptional regulator, partial [Phenylobacterium sp.]